MKRALLYAPICAVFLIVASTTLRAAAPGVGDYTVVVSKATHEDGEWRKVVVALAEKHGGSVVVYPTVVREVLPELREQFPRYTCFVAKPTEASRDFVKEVHRLTRVLDSDPYTDTIWGILTGFDAANALSIAERSTPLEIRRVASGTEIALELCDEGVWYCELEQHRFVKKKRGGEPTAERGPADTTKALVDTLNLFRAQMFVTSGHATERDWQIGYRYRNGSFRSENGQLYGLDTQRERFPIDSPNPKVYLPVGNCLMGHIDGPDAMALAFMKSAGVCQMIGYTVVTWYGYAGWGCLDYFLEQPGRFTFAEAFFANQQALIHRLNTCFPALADSDTEPSQMRRQPIPVTPEAQSRGLTANDARGLLFDRDVVAFYGDPAWEARMAPRSCAWDQSLHRKGDVYTFEIKPRWGERSFQPINTNGSQRGYRPIVEMLPHRVREVEVIEGRDLEPVITDDFLLVPNPRRCDPARAYRVVFRARRAVPPPRGESSATPSQRPRVDVRRF